MSDAKRPGPNSESGAAGRRITARQAEFVNQYLLDLCGKRAAIRAGYSPRTADQIAHQLLQKTSVSSAVAEAMRSRSERTGVRLDDVVLQLAKDLRADMADIFNSDGTVRPVKDWPEPFRNGLVKSMEVREIRSGRGHNRARMVTITRLTFDDRLKLKELMGRHVGAF